ncbi:MAG: aldo/keto reductase [Oscillospiraceae bacterium]|nr:aldo/keto reductase [Oscillospiraceae bacterium]
MQYRHDKYGNKLSVLGYGCMRFSKNGSTVDLDKAEAEIMAAYRAGVNYFDTAFIYPGNEIALGKILAKTGIRDQINLATKLPHYLIKSVDTAEKLFQEELKRLQTDHIDYYLMHMLTDAKTWERLKAMGMEDWIREKKASGAIRQIGFSYHGNSDMFCRLVDANDWDFCMIQYNYLDEHTQAGRTGLRHAHAKGLPVMIMEPLRGGKLVNNLPSEAKRLFADYPVSHSPAEWSFRWLWNQAEVTCVLSGMNSLDMIEENCRIADSARAGELGEADQLLLQQVVAAIKKKMKVGCTGCGYCMPCPRKVDIPGTFSAYNTRQIDGRSSAMWEYLKCTALRKDSTAASNCIGCGKCEQHCPQHIPIRQELQNARKELEDPLYKIMAKLIPIVVRY